MQKKLSKIQQIKKKMGKESEIPSGDEKTERERELRVIQMFRDKYHEILLFIVFILFFQDKTCNSY